ncbi:MAG TPA: hypothetical protein VFL59_05510 [Candidatus Nanopelagicales bacterium]|nr:hypothetical protein [Candidatus Nanopelagicales bacterium]
MRRSPLIVVLSAAALVATGAVSTSANAAGSSGGSQIRFVGTRGALSGASATSAKAVSPPGIGALANGPEIKSTEVEARKNSPQGGSAVLTGKVRPPAASSVPVTQSTSGVTSSFQGLNHFDSRYSGGGNAFSGEPPDQGMCVGGDYVFEIVNSVVQVYTKSGTPLIAGDKAFPSGPSVGLTLNEFYGLPPAIVRPSGPYGPNMFDTACLYDTTSQRWFATSANLDQDPVTGDFTGRNQVWLAVSTSPDPLGSWNIWSIDTTNDGTNGTPNHHCVGGPCFGDYPQIGMDAHGFYITTNEFEFLGDGFNGAQVYALSKADLVAGTPDVTKQVLENVPTTTYNDVAYTMQPVNAMASDWSTAAGGTMYFGMSGSAYTTGLASSIVLYSLSNTSSLDGNSPSLALRETSTATQQYATPGFAQQRSGPMPLLDCVNSVACIGARYPNQKAPLVLDAGNSSKVYGAWLHAGDVYLTTGTPLVGTGAAWYSTNNGGWKAINQRTGVAWFVLHPSSTSTGLLRNGYLAVEGANLTYPSIVVGPTGAGAIGATLVGPTYYPSAAVARFAPGKAPTNVQATGLGIGPNDGFTATSQGGYDPRWGDYPAATVAADGTMWLANEYIASSCTDAEFAVDTTCGFNRTFFANWSTHITAVSPLP